jgi:hypothetical protein
MVNKFSETGNVLKGKSPGRPRQPKETVNAVREAFVRSPKKSIRRAAGELDISYSAVHKILHKDLKFKAYKIQVLHQLLEEDREHRVKSSQEFIEKIETDGNFLSNLIFSDEATFHISGKINRHNCRIWGETNPHEIYEHERDSPKVNVWCALSRSRIYGPFFFEERTINGESYLNMLQQFFIPELKQTPGLLQRAIFQQDGAPPHFARKVRFFLDKTFPERWIGRGGPAVRPDLLT